MPPQESLLLVFCLIDDEIRALGPSRLRPRGPRPTLADSEVIAMERAGEVWGLADDRAIYRHFRRSHAPEFPALAAVSRSTCVRQAADPCGLKRRLQQRLARRLADPAAPWIIDSFPLPACRFARARACRRFAGVAAFGFDPVANEAFYGFRLQLRTGLDGVILGSELAAADRPETERALELAPVPVGTGLGDRNSWSPASRAEFRAAGGELLAPFKHASRDPDPARSGRLLAVRRRIETAIGQLVDRFRCRPLKVKDLWHLEHRLVRKNLSHTAAIWLNVRSGHEPLQLDSLAA